jgi:CRP-like cAMP-binding protein
MFIQKAELFANFDEKAMNEISKIMVQKSLPKDTVLYTENDRAERFYILWEGRVRLAIGKGAKIDYTVSGQGEAFGWSSLVGREVYTATAVCVEPTALFIIEKEALNKIFEKYPASGMIFYRRLTGAVVQRLVATYSAFLAEGNLTGVTSYGTGQVTEPQEA